MKRAGLGLLLAVAGCVIGRPYAPEVYDSLVCADARCSRGSLARFHAERDGSLPADACTALCRPDSDEQVLRCSVATSAITAKPLPRRVAWVFKKRVQDDPGGRYWPDAPAWTTLPDDVSLSGTDPDYLAPSVCQGAYDRSLLPERPPARGLETHFITGCHLMPAAPGPGSEFVQCHIHKQGGTDVVGR